MTGLFTKSLSNVLFSRCFAAAKNVHMPEPLVVSEKVQFLFYF